MGDLRADRYQLIDVLGNGGMGTVWRAWDRLLERCVAVKVLTTSDSHAELALLEEEARAAARLVDPHIVAVYDLVRRSDGRPFLVMELVRGQSLTDVLGTRGRLDPLSAVAVAAQIARALMVAHSHAVVHHDIKPDNVLITREGQVKVIDFGIATIGTARHFEGSSSAQGTAAYAAPELALGRTTDESVDLYSLGCILYQSLAGRPPFRADTVTGLLQQHAYRPPPPLPDTQPQQLAGIVLELLDKHPVRRPTATHLVEKLDSIVRPPRQANLLSAIGRLTAPTSVHLPGADTVPALAAGR